MKKATDYFSPPLLATLAAAALLASCSAEQPQPVAGSITISVIGTNDDHGQLLPVNGNRGLALFGGYVNNLRELRAASGGVVIVIGAGDMWQGTLESNLSEGASVVEAYNALGYAAVAVGNHEFDFGPAGEKAIPAGTDDDPQGALKERAAEAQFPFLAANLIDTTTAKPVDWPNVQPSVLLDVAGVRVGIVGVMAIDALSATMSANTRGLSVAPLATTITAEAQALRAAGAELVIVTAHAGSRCQEFGNPLDLSSCNQDGEIMQVARDLPTGLVDQIVAGHVHQGIAHEVNGIAITSSFANARAFGRVDHTFDLASRKVTQRKIHPPQRICAYVSTSTGDCLAPADAGAVPAEYAGRIVVPHAAVTEIAKRAALSAAAMKSEQLGVYLETPITLAGGTESALANLVVDAIFASADGDVVLLNVLGGLRAILPQGELTFGDVYEMFPFDNRVVELDVSGAELRQVVAREVQRQRTLGISGMRVLVACAEGKLDVELQRPDGSKVPDDDRLTIVTADFLALGGGDVFTSIAPEGGFSLPGDTPYVRDVLVTWLQSRGGRMNASQFLHTDEPRWNFDESFPDACAL